MAEFDQTTLSRLVTLPQAHPSQRDIIFFMKWGLVFLRTTQKCSFQILQQILCEIEFQSLGLIYKECLFNKSLTVMFENKTAFV